MFWSHTEEAPTIIDTIWALHDEEEGSGHTGGVDCGGVMFISVGDSVRAVHMSTVHIIVIYSVYVGARRLSRGILCFFDTCLYVCVF